MIISKVHQMLCCLFFFQAEDGIRDLVRSRGLGDVYKRQILLILVTAEGDVQNRIIQTDRAYSPAELVEAANILNPVSYTHLTLPTSDLV